VSAKNGKFVEKNMGLTSPEAIGGIFCATDRHSDNQSHVLYSVCVCFASARTRVSILARSGQAMWVTLSLLFDVRPSLFGLKCQANIHT
jgi:hypothetical protein